MASKTIDLQHPIFKIAQAAAADLGYPVFAVGGYVRDCLIDRPTKDIDIVCVGSGIALAERCAELIGGSLQVAVFKNFGTAMFRFEDTDVEFVGARKESYQRHSRKPIVEEGSIEDDQNRRDFTINALAVSLMEEDFGRVVDPFQGQKDLAEGVIRTPLDPDITFSDDPLRMMRAIRFATQLGFTIETETLQSIRRNAHRIDIISQERISDELNKIILSPKPSIGFDLLLKTDLIQRIFPEFYKLFGVEVINGIGHKDNYYHTIQVLDNVAENSDDLWLRWSAILHDIAKPQTKRFERGHGWTFHTHEYLGSKMVPRIFRRFKLSMGESMRYVQKLVSLHLRPISLTKENITDSAIRRLLFEAGDDIDDLMTLCRADITSKNKAKVQRYLRNFELVQIKLQEVEEKDRIRNFQPPIDGGLIMSTFDMKPGKEIGIIKQQIKDAILDGQIENDYDQAFNLMLRLGAELGLARK